MPTSEPLATQVHRWVTAQFPLAREQGIGHSDSLLESGIVDSLGVLDIVMFLEEAFGLLVEEDEMVADHFESVEAIVQYIRTKTGV